MPICYGVIPSVVFLCSISVLPQGDEIVRDTFQIYSAEAGYLKGWWEVSGDLLLGEAGPVLTGTDCDWEGGKVSIMRCSNALTHRSPWEST